MKKEYHLLCENPTIIVNPVLYRNYVNLKSFKCYTDGVKIYHLHSIPSPTSVGATYDNYERWSLVGNDGFIVPLYIAVPCNRCSLCLDKKAKDWATRSTCETASCTYKPLFITLTYASDFLPEEGVRKDDLQKFLKRFRINWYRMYSQQLDLRYFAVGEYGRQHCRPHYHLLFWNVPNKGAIGAIELKRVFDCVAKSWSVTCDRDEYRKLKYVRRHKINGVYYKLFGKIDVQSDLGRSGSYCMKYMRKPHFHPDMWINDSFYLSSRRTGGIGCRYLEKYIDSFRRSPGMLKLPVLTDSDCKDYGLPRVFKDKIFPSLSSLLPTFVRSSIERFSAIKALIESINPPADIYEYVNSAYASIHDHYSRAFDYILSAVHLYRKEQQYKHWYDRLHLDLLLKEYRILYVQLYNYQPDCDKLDKLLSLSCKRAEILESRPKILYNIRDEVFNLKKRVLAYEKREIF